VVTRSITTSQPSVACDVCGRTLLRGEQPDVFLASGQRRIVCELCAARAANEGWLRESDGPQVSLRPTRRRRGRTLMGRLRDLRDQGRRGGLHDRDDAGELGVPLEEVYVPAEGAGLEEHHWDAPVHEAEPERDAPVPTPVPAVSYPEARRTPRHVRGVPSNSELRAVRALEVFNLGEAPRRVAGVARSLGPPWVAVRAVAPAGSLVSIAVSWELCWYRYEVDLADEGADAQLVGQGMELHELSEEDRQANAQADERGELQMIEAPALEIETPELD
jgi:hypothetical protein